MPVPRDFRRAIVLHAVDATTVHGAVEDDYHHFAVTLRHDGRVVRSVRGEAHRHPWTTCPGAVGRLQDFVGVRLGDAPLDLPRDLDATDHCTHLFDLVALAAGHARRGGRRRYDVHVPRRVGVAGRTRPTLRVDGAVVLAWEVAEGRVVAPEPFTGMPLRGGFRAALAERIADPEVLEHAVVLRRMTDLMVMVDLKPAADVHPRELVPFTRPICHTMRDDVIVVAERPPGHRDGGVDWTHELPLAGGPAATAATAR